MNDKSPRQQLSKKSGKSLKQKRAAKRATDAGTATVIPSTRKPTGKG